MAKLVWRVKLVAELGADMVSETEVAAIERDDCATPETLGLSLAEGKQLTCAIQATMVRAQVATMGERFRCCGHCGTKLLSKGYYPATFRSIYGEVAVKVRRMNACPCRGQKEAKSLAATEAVGGISPELAYVTAKFAALAPFARVADMLSELLPIGGAVNAGTVRNRTLRVGMKITKVAPAVLQRPEATDVAPAVVVGLDGGYVRSRHRRPERNFEIIAGKVIGTDGSQHRFAFARNDGSVRHFARALLQAGVRDGALATVLLDGDIGLRHLQRRVLPQATVVLDWFHIAMRFEHALQTAIGLGAGAPDAYLGGIAYRDLNRAKWRLWHGRWKGCLITLVHLRQWTQTRAFRDVPRMGAFRRHLHELLAYLEANQTALVNYASRRRHGEPISTAFVQSAVNEIVARRMIKKQQMRWNRWTVQPFLDVRVAVLNGTLLRSFRKVFPNFRLADNPGPIALAA
jgi:hypothetical protein